jgi:undecaprenyl-diphosphatase
LLFAALAPPLERALSWLGNRTARFRYRDYLPVVVLLAAGVIVTANAGDEFLDLAELVHARSPLLQEVDRRAHDWAAAERSTGATAFFTFFTIAGTPVALGGIVAVASAILIFQKRFRWAAYLIFTTVMGALLVLQLKSYFARERPDLAVALRHADGYSFPSGHAMGSTVVSGALAYLALRACRTWRAKAAALAAAATFVLAVAFSRVYLGVHWISDIAAGFAAGLTWITTATVAYEAFRRIRLIRELRRRATTPE